MKPTSLKNLTGFFLLSLIFGFFIPNIYENISSTYIPVSLNTAIALIILDAALLYWILIFRNRINSANQKNKDILKRKTPPHPLVSARTVALAFAGSRAGTLIFGFYAGLLINFLPKIELAPIQNRIFKAIVIVITSLVLIGLSLWLEKICRIKESDDEPGEGTSFA
ncbi:MAG: DUF3180 domain-containing protein [Candidatus Nanopelagicales bacterium]